MISQETGRTGIILYVHHYQACLRFYKDLLELPILFDTPNLTCFEFGHAYLMVERQDANDPPLGFPNPTFCLRFNVPDVKRVRDRLVARGVAVDYQEHTWGIIAKFRDPEGNLIGIKDEEKFEQQIREH